MEVVIESLTKKWPGFTLGPISIKIPDGAYVGIAGPNGSGKTTLLLCIAGLIACESGTVAMGGRNVTPLPPEKRPASYLFPEPMLFPNMDVRQNLLFQPRRGKVEPSEADSIAAAFGVGGMLHKKPAQLSTGNRRRVDVARALLSRPGVLLLDEPFNFIDSDDRGQIASSLMEYVRSHKVTVLHVSHLPGDLETADTRLKIVDGKLQG